MTEYDLANITRRNISQIRRLEGVEKATENKKSKCQHYRPARSKYVHPHPALFVEKSEQKYRKVSKYQRLSEVRGAAKHVQQAPGHPNGR